MIRVAAVLVAVLGSGCIHFECVVHGGQPVRTVKTEHFAITSDLPTRELSAQAESFELLWDTFAEFFHADVPAAGIQVVLLSSTSVVESFASGYSGFVRRKGPTALVVGAPGEDGQQGSNPHELTHLVSAYMLPRQPRWVAEGLATLFEDATFKNARTVKMGLWNRGRAEEAFVIGVLDLDTLSAWGGLRFDDRESLYYASAWAWIHYLANHDEARLRRLFDGLRGSRPLPAVMAEVFPPAEAKRLRDAVQAYLGEARFRGWETSLRRTPHLSEPQVLAPWEVHLLRSELYLKDDAAVRRELAQTVALAPSPLPPAAAVVKARLEDQPVAPLLERYPTAPAVLVAAYEEIAGSVSPEQLAQAVTPQTTDPQLLLVAAEAALAGDALEQAEQLAARGFGLAPWSPELARTLVDVSLARARCEEAGVRASVLEALGPERATEQFTRQLARVREAIAACRPQQR